MKIKVDFVTNSSSASFIVIGIYLKPSDLPQDVQDFDSFIDANVHGTDLHYSFGLCDGYSDNQIMIGIPYTKMKDDETLGEFKLKVEKQLKESLGVDSNPGHIEACWENR